MAKVTEQDLADKVESECTYVLDTSRRNITEAKVKEDGSTTLKLYFKQQFTVTYSRAVKELLQSSQRVIINTMTGWSALSVKRRQ